jgi:anti-sigma factor RsiW
MNCDEANGLLHALVDEELDAGHARQVEAHVEGCGRCAAELKALQDMRAMLRAAPLRYSAPPALRRRIDDALPRPRAAAPNRRSLLKGFALGTALSAAAAAGLVMVVLRDEQDQAMLGDAISAHLRSLQADHLTDVQSTDQHTVKPWFNGRLEVAPPVVDLTAQGFTLIGGRLDYIDGRPVAAIVYKRRAHVINLFVMQQAGAAAFAPKVVSVHGFNIRRWSDQGLELLAVSDINTEELQEFTDKFQAALRAGGPA